eukprot:gene19193-biopygen938
MQNKHWENGSGRVRHASGTSSSIMWDAPGTRPECVRSHTPPLTSAARKGVIFLAVLNALEICSSQGPVSTPARARSRGWSSAPCFH